jgi:hypothetical protein
MVLTVLHLLVFLTRVLEVAVVVGGLPLAQAKTVGLEVLAVVAVNMLEQDLVVHQHKILTLV